MAMSLPALRNYSRLRSLSFPNAKALLSKSRFLSTALQEKSNNKNESDLRGNVAYPPVKPKFPPGEWGDMNRLYAWQWHKLKEEILDIPDVQGRLSHINSSEMTHIYAIPDVDYPDYDKFASFATKSCLFSWVEHRPQIYKEIESMVEKSDLTEKIKQVLIDQIIMENDIIVREDSLNEQQTRSKLILRCIADTLVTQLNDVNKNLSTYMYDEDVIVRTLWDRHGIKRTRRVKTGKNSFKIVSVMDHRIISSCIFDGMIRSDLPLPQVVPIPDGCASDHFSVQFFERQPSRSYTLNHRPYEIVPGTQEDYRWRGISTLSMTNRGNYLF